MSEEGNDIAALKRLLEEQAAEMERLRQQVAQEAVGQARSQETAEPAAKKRKKLKLKNVPAYKRLDSTKENICVNFVREHIFTTYKYVKDTKGKGKDDNFERVLERIYKKLLIEKASDKSKYRDHIVAILYDKIQVHRDNCIRALKDIYLNKNHTAGKFFLGDWPRDLQCC